MKKTTKRPSRKRKCQCCGSWFLPDCWNAYHQYCCSKPDCQKARKRRNQQAWRRRNPLIARVTTDKERENNKLRMRVWRAAHPGRKPYAKRLISIYLKITGSRPGKRRIHVQTEQLKTGVLQNLCLPYVHEYQSLTFNLNPWFRDFFGTTGPFCYFSSPRPWLSPFRRRKAGRDERREIRTFSTIGTSSRFLPRRPAQGRQGTRIPAHQTPALLRTG